MSDLVQDRSPDGSTRQLRMTFDGVPVSAFAGQTIAAALLAQGLRIFRYSPRKGQPRGLFCGMGICFDCLVQVDGRPNVGACQTAVADGMCVQTQHGDGTGKPAE
jgi:predicted molibdopterin-dependent oxidoreductase YjgC